MGSHPLNLALRLALEIGALVALGYWGFSLAGPWLPWVVGLGLPTGAATVWGVFAVPDDPSRSGKTVVVTPGPLRLALELALFGGASVALYAAGEARLGVAFGVVTLVHYAASWDRVAWLFRR